VKHVEGDSLIFLELTEAEEKMVDEAT